MLNACPCACCLQNARLLAAYVAQKQEAAQLKEELRRHQLESEVCATVDMVAEGTSVPTFARDAIELALPVVPA